MLLQKLCEQDVADLYVLDQDPEVRRYIDDGKPPEPWPIFQQEALRKIESYSAFGPELGFWSARLADDSFIGWFHLRPNRNVFPGEMEIGYRLQRKFWGQGLGTEGTLRLLDYAFSDLKLTYVMATTLKANLGSQRVMEKAGMRFERDFVYPEKLAPYWDETQRIAVKYSIVGQTEIKAR